MNRILLADDHSVLRDGLRALIVTNPEMEVVGEAADLTTLMGLVDELTPDLVVMDLSMPGGNPIESIQSITVNHRQTRVLVLTMFEDLEYLRSALAAGAAGYVLKRSAYTALMQALSAVREGHVYVDPSFPPDREVTDGRAPDAPALSAREREVLGLLARGLTYKEVGAQLSIGARTVETHRRRLAEKLGLKSRAELLRYALDQGLIRRS
jgi:two-component system, NarL family, response regulator NreC